MIHKHEFETVDGKKASVTLKNTMRNDITNDVLAKRFASDGQADQVKRANFILFMSHVESVKGIEWLPVDENATEEQFMDCYYGFAELVDTDTAYACALTVARLGQRIDPLEKPDQALTEDEAADPNS